MVNQRKYTEQAGFPWVGLDKGHETIENNVWIKHLRRGKVLAKKNKKKKKKIQRYPASIRKQKKKKRENKNHLFTTDNQ